MPKKYYLVEVEQTGTASVCIEASSEGDAKEKVRSLLREGTCEMEMLNEWDTERVTTAREYSHPDGLDLANATANAQALADLS